MKAKAKSKKLDRRVVRTRRLLREALMALITERGYDSITVQDITDKADIARATFYLHYRDKDELLSNSLEDVYDDLVGRLGPLDLQTLWSADNPVDLIAFEHVAEHIDFYRVILGEQGVASFLRRLRLYLVNVAKELFDPIITELAVDPQMVDLYLHNQSGALIGTLSWWIENDMPKTAEEMARITHHIGLDGLRWIMENRPFQNTNEDNIAQ